MKEAKTEKIKPPAKPSHDFLGETDGIILVFPKRTPNRQAKVSKVQVRMNINKIREGSNTELKLRLSIFPKK